MLGDMVLQVWWWYLHWFRRYRKKTRGARNSPPPSGARVKEWELKFWTPVNFEVEYFLNEETEGVLTDTAIYFSDQHLTWLSQLKPNAKVGKSL